jgi:hypothetical protein
MRNSHYYNGQRSWKVNRKTKFKGFKKWIY